MPDAFQAEFTGERVIPGRVEENLFNEHLARYRFAAHLARELALSGDFLDAGCGAGYGAAQLTASATRVLAIDISDEALDHARQNYAAPNLRFEQASCTSIPADDGAFRLVTAFEVIEHLPEWRDFLREARRVLHPAGMFLVSTPNRLYYAESREKAGPNPFHVHEFTEDEFRAELASTFPHVKILLQNHVEGIALSGADTQGAALEISGHTSDSSSDPSSAHFFLAVCGIKPLPPIAQYIFIPDTGNVLQTREHHIALLDGEIRQKNQWIEQEKAARARMKEKVRELEGELEEHNRWARQANEEAERRARLVAQLQDELRRSNEWAQRRDAEAVERGERIVRLQDQLHKSNEWAQQRDAEAVERGERIVQLQGELHKSNQWAQQRDAEAVERGHRVEQLQDEVAQSTAWARARDAEAEERSARVIELQEEVARATEWARSRDAEAEERGARILELQAEMQREQQLHAAEVLEMEASRAGYEAAIAQWRLDKEASDRWAMDTERRLSAERDEAREAFAGKQIEYESALERIAALEADLGRIREQMTDANARLDMIAQSRWVRLGRGLRVGPEISRN